VGGILVAKPSCGLDRSAVRVTLDPDRRGRIVGREHQLLAEGRDASQVVREQARRSSRRASRARRG
jgi:hypothetical protein